MCSRSRLQLPRNPLCQVTTSAMTPGTNTHTAEHPSGGTAQPACQEQPATPHTRICRNPLPLGSRCPSRRLKTNKQHSQPSDLGKSVSLCPPPTELCSKSTACQWVQQQASVNSSCISFAYKSRAGRSHLATLQFRDHQPRVLFSKR